MSSLSIPFYHTTNTNQETTPETSNFGALSFPSSPGISGGLKNYIEQFHRNDGCNTPKRPWMIATNHALNHLLFFRPTCKTWNCPACGQDNAEHWIRRAEIGTKQLLEQGWKLDFLTLTPHEKLTPAQSFYVLPRAWKKLHIRYQREIAGRDPGSYFVVPERMPKSGKVHSHFIITGGLTQRWWKNNARECGLGYQCESKQINSIGPAGYVTKYLTKTLTEQWPKGRRRVNTSRNWPVVPKSEELVGWEFSTHATDQQLSLLLDVYSAQGLTVLGLTTENAWKVLNGLSHMGDENEQ